jgi:hypothetical protein
LAARRSPGVAIVWRRRREVPLLHLCVTARIE